MRILHISDLHFAVPSDGARSQNAKEELLEYLKIQSAIHKVIITGDFQDAKSISDYYKLKSRKQAVMENFGRIVEFLNELKDVLKLEAKDILFTPGNHDCSCAKRFRAPVLSARKEYDLAEGRVLANKSKAINARFAFFWELCDKFYGTSDENPWREHNAIHPCITLLRDDTAVLLLNSSILSFVGEDDPGVLFDRNAINETIKGLLEGNGDIRRILLCAHNSMQDMSSDELRYFINMLKRYQKRGIDFVYLCGDTHSPFFEKRSGIFEYRIGSIGGQFGNEQTFNIYNLIENQFSSEEYVYCEHDGGEPCWMPIQSRSQSEKLKQRNRKQHEQLCGNSGRYYLTLSELEDCNLNDYIQNELGECLGDAVHRADRFLNIVGESGSGKTTALLTHWRRSVEKDSNTISLFVPMYAIDEKHTIEMYLIEKYAVTISELCFLAETEKVELLLDAINESNSSVDSTIRFLKLLDASAVRVVVTSTVNFFTDTACREMFDNFHVSEFNEKSRQSILQEYGIDISTIDSRFLNNAMHFAWFLGLKSQKSMERKKRINESHGINVLFESSNNAISLFVNRLRSKLCELIEIRAFGQNPNSVYHTFVDLFWITPMVCSIYLKNNQTKINCEDERDILAFLQIAQSIMQEDYKESIGFEGRADKPIEITASTLLSSWKEKAIFRDQYLGYDNFFSIDFKYLEYFQALHIANAVLLSQKSNIIHPDISDLFLSKTAVRLSLLRLEQGSIVLRDDSASNIPDPFFSLIELLRNKRCDEYPYALANIISFLQELQRSIENADLSNLDFQNAKLNKIYFKQCNFKKSYLYRDSIVPQGHSGDVSSICFVPNSNGRYFVSASYDSDLRIWDAKNGNCIYALTCKPYSFIHHISFSLNGRLLAVAMRNGYVNLYNYINHELHENNSVKIDSVPIWHVEFDQFGNLLTASESGKVQVYDTHTEEKVIFRECGSDAVCAVYNNDCSKILACFRDYQIFEWDATDLKKAPTVYQTDKSHGFPTSVAYDQHNDNKFYSAGESGTITIWENGRATSRLYDDRISSDDSLKRAHKNWIYSICSLKNKNLLVSSSFDGCAKIWDTQDKTLYRDYQQANKGSSLRCAVVDQNGEFLVTGSVDGRITLRNIHNPSATIDYAGQNRSLINLSLSKDGSRLLSPGEEFHIQEYSISDGEDSNGVYTVMPSAYKGHSDSVIYSEYSPDGKYVASSSYDFNIMLWNIETPTPKKIWHHENAAMSARFCRTEPYVLSASYDGHAIEWPMEGGCEIKYGDLDGRSLRTAIYATLKENDNKIIIGNFGGKIVEAERGTDKREVYYQHMDCGIIMSMDLSKNGRFLLSASDRNMIIEWDRYSQKEFCHYKCQSAVFSVQYSSDNDYILAALFNGEIWEWKRGENQRVHRMYVGHSKPVTYAIYGADGTKVLSTSYDGTIREWDRSTADDVPVQLKSKIVAMVVSGVHYDNCIFDDTHFVPEDIKTLIVKPSLSE